MKQPGARVEEAPVSQEPTEGRQRPPPRLEERESQTGVSYLAEASRQGGPAGEGGHADIRRTRGDDGRSRRLTRLERRLAREKLKTDLARQETKTAQAKAGREVFVAQRRIERFEGVRPWALLVLVGVVAGVLLLLVLRAPAWVAVTGGVTSLLAGLVAYVVRRWIAGDQG